MNTHLVTTLIIYEKSDRLINFESLCKLQYLLQFVAKDVFITGV